MQRVSVPRIDTERGQERVTREWEGQRPAKKRRGQTERERKRER